MMQKAFSASAFVFRFGGIVARRLPFLISLLFFLTGMAWFSRGAVFPPFYHPDEINKVLQIQANFRNFNHPQLMLNTAALLNWAAGSPAAKDRMVAVMRAASVFFSAAAVAMLAYVAWMMGGVIAQVLCGWLLLTQPMLFELSHYLKEDPALAMGFAAIYLTFALYVRAPSTRRTVWLGVAAALAISAKYVGVFPAVLALAGLAWRYDGDRRRVWIFLGVCLLGLVAINWQGFLIGSRFQSGLGREISLFEERHVSLVNPRVVNDAMGEIGVCAWLALAAWLASPWYRGRRLDASQWLILAATFGYAGMLLLSSRSATRYLLPIAASLPLIIAVAAVWVGGWLAARLRQRAVIGQAALALLVAVVFGAQNLPAVENLRLGFYSDTRLQLVGYIRGHLPAAAILAEDAEVKLPDGRSPRRDWPAGNLPQDRLHAEEGDHLADEFTVAQLREKGATHVVIFVDGSVEAVLKGKTTGREKLAGFMTDLDKNGRLLWSSESRSPVYLNPALRFYELRPQ